MRVQMKFKELFDKEVLAETSHIRKDLKIYYELNLSLIKAKKLKNVTAARITDTQSGVSFVFEPNENCGFSYNPIIFKRPCSKCQKLSLVDLTSVASFFWEIDIEPGMETEKNLNFTIISTKKSKNK